MRSLSTLLEVSNLVVSFQTYLGKIHAVRSVSFSLHKGETIALVGESGCGKSATAHALMQLIPEPTGVIEAGAIYLEGIDLLKKSKKQMQQIRGKEVAMVFQDPMTGLNPTMPIGKQLIEGPLYHQGLSAKEATQRALEMLELVGISDPERRLKQYPHAFSGGMRQRVMIALALASHPKVLIADEPTTALDVTIQAQILELMKRIQKETGTSIILITHDLGIVAGMCDRVLVMYGGEIVESGSVEAMYQSPKHPYTQGLLRSIPRLDREADEELIPIPGTPPSLLHSPKGCAFCPRCPHAMHICVESRPPLSPTTETHQVACWLQHRPL